MLKRITNLNHPEFEGGLGSRLYKENDQSDLAYAQWPDKVTLDNYDGNLPEKALKYLAV